MDSYNLNNRVRNFMKKKINQFILFVLPFLLLGTFLPAIASITTSKAPTKTELLLHTNAASGDLLWNYTTTEGIRSVDISANGNFITASTYDPDSSVYLFNNICLFCILTTSFFSDIVHYRSTSGCYCLENNRDVL